MAIPLKNATFRVPKAVWQRAKKRAIDEDRSLNDVVVKALESYAGQPRHRGARLLAHADRLLRKRGTDAPGPRFTKDELHEHDDA